MHQQPPPDMPSMQGVNLAGPTNQRKIAAAKQQNDDDDGGWGDTAALLDWRCCDRKFEWSHPPPFPEF